MTPLVDGASYFSRLLDRLSGLRSGDLVLFTDWRGDADERLGGVEGTELGTVFVELLERGVDVRGRVWRSHPDAAHLSEEEALHLAEAVNEAGGEVLLDERVRRAGSHHQKLVLVHHAGREGEVLRTYPSKRPPYPFAPDGERSIARAYRKALARARCLIYIEDQYLWSAPVAETLARGPADPT